MKKVCLLLMCCFAVTACAKKTENPATSPADFVAVTLGDAAAMPVRGMLKHYWDEFAYHVEHKHCMVGGHAHAVALAADLSDPDTATAAADLALPPSLLADLLARTLHPPLELPAGVLTAIIGAPWFIWLLVRMR